MRFCGGKVRRLQNRPYQLIIEPQHLIEQFAVLNVIALLVTVKLHRISHHLLFCDWFENEEI